MTHALRAGTPAKIEAAPRLLNGGLRWIDAHVDQFRFRTEVESPLIFRMKALSELAFLCGRLARAGRYTANSRPRKWIRVVNEEIEGFRAVDAIYRSPETFLPFATIYLALKQCGIDREDMRSALQAVLDRGHVLEIERPAFRQMDLAFVLREGGFHYRGPTLRQLLGQTLLAKRPSALDLSIGDAYQITHVLFYVGDFGLRRISGLDSESIASARRLVTSLLAINLRRRNWDLLAELLVNAVSLRIRPPLVYEESWRSLGAAQEADGLVPGPFFDAKRAKSFQKLRHDRFVFENNYHTVLVSALAAVADPGAPQPSDPTIRPALSPGLPIQGIRDACKATVAWLGRQPIAELPPACAVDTLIGLWIDASAGNREQALSAASIARRIADRLDEFSFDAFEEIDPTRALMVSRILDRLGIKRRRFHANVTEVAAALNYSHPSDLSDAQIAALRLLRTARLLDLGATEELSETLPATRFPSGATLDAATRANVLLATLVENNGNGKTQSPLLARFYGELALDMMDAFQSYDLELGMKIIRTVNAAGFQRLSGFEDAIFYLLGQIREDGRVGFMGPEIDAAAMSGDPLDEASVYSGLAMNAIWTWRELLAPGFQVWRELGAINGGRGLNSKVGGSAMKRRDVAVQG